MAKSTKKAAPDYGVGKGKPPKSKQFKPGQSGNANGSSAKAKAKAAEKAKARAAALQPVLHLIAKELLTDVTVGDGDKRETMTCLQALARQLVRQVLGAPLLDKLRFMKEFKALGGLDECDRLVDEAKREADDEAEVPEFTEEDRRLLEGCMAFADTLDEQDRRDAELYRREHGYDGEGPAAGPLDRNGNPIERWPDGREET